MLVFISLFTFFGCNSQVKEPNSELVSATEVESEPQNKYEFSVFKTTWETTARGFTEAEGLLWVPQINFTIKNTGLQDIENLYFKAIFLDSENVIKGDDSIESIDSIPASYSKGPIFIQGSVGYTSDYAFIDMLDDASKSWRFDLFEGESYSGPWKKIKSGTIELPEQYKAMRKQ